MARVKEWYCGNRYPNNITATLRGNTLTISGSGVMIDYGEKDNPAPWRNESVTHIIIEDNITNIGDYAFYDYIGLVSINIGNDVKKVGSYAFGRCSAIKVILLPDSIIEIRKGAFSSCLELTNINIPHNTERIGESAFDYCKSLISILIPESVRNIGRCVFSYCYSLERIISESIIPQREDSWAFARYSSGSYDHFNDNTILYVPSSSIETYKKARGWSYFKNILPIESLDSNYETKEEIDIQINQLEVKKVEFENEISNLNQQIIDLNFRKSLLKGLEGNPKQVAEFMYLLNQRDGLKYLTHDIDESGDFNHEEILSQLKEVCTTSFSEKDIPKSLMDLFNQFIFEEEPKWKSFDRSYDEIEVSSGWASNDWEEARNSNLHPIRLPKYEDIIRNFKRATRIESPYLENLIQNVFADEEFEINTDKLSRADFYTHVGEFKAALETIFGEIKKRADTGDKKTVSVEYKNEISEDFFIRKIIITHHNSYPTRDDKEVLMREWLSLNKGCMAKIGKHLQGYCHWSVETLIDDEPVRVNILRGKETEPHESIDEEDIDGFRHILTFYYEA